MHDTLRPSSSTEKISFTDNPPLPPESEFEKSLDSSVSGLHTIELS